ncbi:TIGR03668 family PPOX class F420-dependent oxidoreductase [Nocardia sp. CDC153]|uniref:TIGR03668 family PPOX class F420-dependent oxidoreductase n=1 Tax=Nocardia sp. CDC153 TaxID=3112167 RepID=UPI002DB72E1E|nr:TIGR03668 family PPOX class F420-dependent oxidoreductase [Nocardia sp. CDC153]MEC3954171.1 TIGR03668 family PPOX class F420-dependent oxidoreductase [Nocardia sp. CDC153]
MRLDKAEALSRFRAARVAHLATADDAGQPHLVPVTFAVSPTDTPLYVVIAVDHKPKMTANLRRLRNIESNPLVSLLADEYDEDWTRLWWARLDGEAEILTAAADLATPLEWLSAKYAQYRAEPPAGPVIRIAVASVRGWAYSA